MYYTQQVEFAYFSTCEPKDMEEKCFPPQPSLLAGVGKGTRDNLIKTELLLYFSFFAEGFLIPFIFYCLKFWHFCKKVGSEEQGYPLISTVSQGLMLSSSVRIKQDLNLCDVTYEFVTSGELLRPFSLSFLDFK